MARGGVGRRRAKPTGHGGGPRTPAPPIPAAARARIEAMWIVHLALTLAVLYAAVLTGMYLAQTWLLFPTTLAGLARVQLPTSAQRLEIGAPDGEVLAGVRIPAEGERDEHTPTLLGFGGNAWNAEAMALDLHDLFPGRA